MKEGEFIRKVGGEEKGPLKCRKPREPKQSSTNPVHPSVSGNRVWGRCNGLEGKTQGALTMVNGQRCHVQPHWSPRQKGKKISHYCLIKSSVFEKDIITSNNSLSRQNYLGQRISHFLICHKSQQCAYVSAKMRLQVWGQPGGTNFLREVWKIRKPVPLVVAIITFSTTENLTYVLSQSFATQWVELLRKIRSSWRTKETPFSLPIWIVAWIILWSSYLKSLPGRQQKQIIACNWHHTLITNLKD